MRPCEPLLANTLALVLSKKNCDNNLRELKQILAYNEKFLDDYELAHSNDSDFVETRRNYESQLLDLNKQIARIELLMDSSSLPAPQSTSTNPFSDDNNSSSNSTSEQQLDAAELLQLQSHIISDQDEHLTLLSHSITRQKEIGLQIHEELEHHIDLLEDTEERVESTQTRLGFASRRLRAVEQGLRSGGDRSCWVIGVLLV
ncbi:hypothetical protein HK098_006957, partial [Nowakowskiella sp. JEL0407]